MPIYQAFILGVVQGLTEFLPISSSGHLVIVPALFGWGEPGLAFDVLLHVGSLIALLIYFFDDLMDVLRGLIGRDPAGRKLLYLLIIGTIPAVIAGVLFKDAFAKGFTDAKAAAVQLVITALILIAAELAFAYHRRRAGPTGTRVRMVQDLGAADAGVIGIAQAIAIIPGISRSGSTIGAGLALRMARDDAARFSFLLSVPALLGAALLEAPAIGKGIESGLAAGLVGCLTSLVVSYAAIAGLIRFLKTHTLYPFAVYCVVFGTLFYFLV
jgi:undecaprenyl-diphosphatase